MLLSTAHQMCPDDIISVQSYDAVKCSLVLTALTCGCVTLWSTAPCKSSLLTGTMQNIFITEEMISTGRHSTAPGTITGHASYAGDKQYVTGHVLAPCLAEWEGWLVYTLSAVSLNNHCMVCSRAGPETFWRAGDQQCTNNRLHNTGIMPTTVLTTTQRHDKGIMP